MVAGGAAAASSLHGALLAPPCLGWLLTHLASGVLRLVAFELGAARISLPGIRASQNSTRSPAPPELVVMRWAVRRRGKDVLFGGGGPAPSMDVDDQWLHSGLKR